MPPWDPADTTPLYSPYERIVLQEDVRSERAQACGQNTILDPYCWPDGDRADFGAIACRITVTMQDGSLWLDARDFLFNNGSVNTPGKIMKSWPDHQGHDSFLIEEGEAGAHEVWVRFAEVGVGDELKYSMQFTYFDRSVGERLVILIVDEPPVLAAPAE